MIDLNHFWGGDLSASATGDLLAATDTITGEQRVLRRLMTNPALVDDTGTTQASADYIFHPSYGAGLGRLVGSPINIPATQAVIDAQMAQEQAVATLPAPVIGLTTFQNGLNAFIQYNDAASKKPVTLDFDVTQ